MPDSNAEPANEPAPVVIAGLRLRFEVDGAIVKVTHADSGGWVGNAYAFTRADGPLFHPCFLYRDDLGTRADDPRGSDQRDLIAAYAKEVRHAATQEAQD